MKHIKRFIKRMLIWSGMMILTLVLTAYLYERYKIHEFYSVIEDDPYYLLDSIAGHVHSPNFTRRVEWPEHKDGFLVMATNNLGFRKDVDTEVEKPDSTFRVLVTGDSHTDGVINNSESFPNLLEDRLNKKYPRRKFEFLNGGTGFYSFSNYVGFLKKYLYIKPDMFIVTVYGGNDFIETLLMDSENLNLVSTLETFWYRMKKKQFHYSTDMASTQSTNQALFYRMYPQKWDRTLSLVIANMEEIRRLCAENNIQLFVAIMPTKFMTEEIAKKRLEIKAGWTKLEMNMNRSKQVSLHSWLNGQQIPNVHLVHNIFDTGQTYYWDTDHHLNPTGHKAIADFLVEGVNWESF